MSKPIITVDDIRAAAPGSVLPIPAGAIVTDLAREVARANQISLVTSDHLTSTSSTNGPGPVIAIGADHGPSFPMKEALKPYLAELGYTVLDCGTYTPDAVDYPDIAYAVAKQVANGTAWRGIVIDGAGIGSSMAANKGERNRLGTYRWSKKGICFVKRAKMGRVGAHKRIEPTCDIGYTGTQAKKRKVGSGNEV